MFKLRILTPEGVYFNEEVSSLTVKLITGYATILSKHLPMMAALEYAPMHLIKNNKTYYYAIHGGVLNIKEKEVVIITTSHGAISKQVNEKMAYSVTHSLFFLMNFLPNYKK